MPWRIQNSLTFSSLAESVPFAESGFDCPVCPILEVFGLDFVAIDESIRFSVVCVNIDFLFAGEEFQNHVEILTKFFGGSRAAGIVTRSLYTARKTAVAFFESPYVVALPAVYGNRRFISYFHFLINVDAEFGVVFFCVFVTFLNIVHNDS